MNKKTIITIIILLIIAILAPKIFDKNKVTTKPVEETSPRNDTVATEEKSTTTETLVKSYLLTEIALHDKKEDCWLAIDGKVINATQFIAAGLHPNDKILNGCGKDASEMFASVKKHDGGKAQVALKQYEIGVLK